MTRSLAEQTLAAIHARESADVFLALVTIRHDSLVVPIRVVNDSADIVSRGEDFIRCPFEVVLPDQREGQIPVTKLKIQNIDRALVSTVRSVKGDVRVTVEIIRAAAPDDVEISFPDFALKNVKYDELVIEGDLTLENLLSEPFPSGKFTPAQFPGMF